MDTKTKEAYTHSFMRPEFSEAEAIAFANDFYDVSGTAKQLPSYSDQNFLLDTGAQKFVLKITNGAEPFGVLDFQQKALIHLAKCAADLKLPKVITANNNRTLIPVAGKHAEASHLVWMVSFLPGKFIADLAHPPLSVLEELGAVMGRLDTALSSFSHKYMHRDLQWDLQQADQLHDFLPLIADESQRKLVEHFLKRLDTHVIPLADQLQKSVIHNDANDNNVLITRTNENYHIGGLIDFGDMLYSYTIAEVAIAAAYMILEKDNPIEIIQAILKGYASQFPVNESDLAVLFDLVCLRLCTSVCMSARERKAEPDNEYLAISEQPAWNTLNHLVTLNPTQAIDQFVLVQQ